MIYLILPLNRSKLNNNSVSKLWYKYFDTNMNTAIITTLIIIITIIIIIILIIITIIIITQE